MIAHCVAWAEICARILDELAAGTLDLDDYRDLPVGDATDDGLNERQVAELRDVSVDALLVRLSRATERAATTLRGFGGDPPAELVLLTVGDHLAEHTEELRSLGASGA